jgi:FHS family glucose/mannose:H+ symporter-like MFS transporter
LTAIRRFGIAPQALRQQPDREVPAAPLLHLALLLTGLGTALLGPILPLLSRHWHLQDQQSGLLLAAQFMGAFTGGLTVSKRLRRSLVLSLAAAAIGFTGFAMASALVPACVLLFLAGWGVGQCLTACNIIAGRRYSTRRGSAMALLNFSWSVGAMLSPLLAAWLTPRYPLRHLIEGFAGCFLGVLILLLGDLRGMPAEIVSTSDAPTGTASASRLAPSTYLYFIALLFLYGGVETSISGWLTTYALRYGNRNLTLSEYTTLVLWTSLTVGRAFTSILLLRMKEATLLRLSLLLSAIFIAGLALAHGAWSIAAFAVLLGLSLAPFFPSSFSIMMGDRPSARQAGVVLAVSGVGAAILPSLMGVLSTHTGSLQLALAVPFSAALILLGLSLSPPAPSSEPGAPPLASDT